MSNTSPTNPWHISSVEQVFATLGWVDGSQRRVLAMNLRGGSATVPAPELPTCGSFELLLSDGFNTTRVTLPR